MIFFHHYIDCYSDFQLYLEHEAEKLLCFHLTLLLYSHIQQQPNVFGLNRALQRGGEQIQCVQIRRREEEDEEL